ncbi:unnamed protein product [marine sediment metagenome]|uniref:Uncharacterized protein n=1 Tax=marine sediment metagenome TaxID=412755 RepID=X1PM03_9ZZZZ
MYLFKAFAAGVFLGPYIGMGDDLDLFSYLLQYPLQSPGVVKVAMAQYYLIDCG